MRPMHHPPYRMPRHTPQIDHLAQAIAREPIKRTSDTEAALVAHGRELASKINSAIVTGHATDKRERENAIASAKVLEEIANERTARAAFDARVDAYAAKNNVLRSVAIDAVMRGHDKIGIGKPKPPKGA